MTFKEQCKEWVKDHPKATLEDAWEAGYLTSNFNWCNKTK